MNEERIVKSILNIIETKCIKDGIKEPKSIELNMGVFNTYSRQDIILIFDELKKKSKMIGSAVLKITSKNGKIKCNRCQEESEIDKVCEIDEVTCPKCASFDIKIIEGEEIEVGRIEKS